jgi:hypothetical protein
MFLGPEIASASLVSPVKDGIILSSSIIDHGLSSISSPAGPISMSLPSHRRELHLGAVAGISSGHESADLGQQRGLKQLAMRVDFAAASQLEAETLKLSDGFQVRSLSPSGFPGSCERVDCYVGLSRPPDTLVSSSCFTPAIACFRDTNSITRRVETLAVVLSHTTDDSTLLLWPRIEHPEE